MRRSASASRTVALAVFGLGHFFVLAAPIVAEDAPADQARYVMERFVGAWNRADVAGLREAMNFPFVTVFEGRLTVAETPEDFTVDFDRLRAEEGWHHSTLDAFEVTRASEDQVHGEVTFSRYRRDGSRYRTGSGLYVFTRRDGEWGMQLGAFAPPAESREGGESGGV